MYTRMCQGFRTVSNSRRGVIRTTARAPKEKELESEAWQWLAANEKLGVGDLVREGRWDDALMFLNFVTSSYRRRLRRDSIYSTTEYMLSSSPSTPRGKQAIIEAMISCQLTVYQRLQLEEFINTPIEECSNPLAIGASIMAAAAGSTLAHSSREVTVKPMDPREAWVLLQSLLRRVNGTRGSIRKIRDWAYRLPSCDRKTLLLCAADFKGRIRRPMVPIIITIFYTSVKGALRQSEEMAWSSLQAIISRMSTALRNQMCAYMYSYRKLGYFHFYNLGPTKCCLNDNYLRVCNDLLNDLPRFLWHDLYQSLTEKYKISMERRKCFLNRPTSSPSSAPTKAIIFDGGESDDFALA